MACKCVDEVNALLRKEKGFELDVAFTIPFRKGEKSVTYPQLKLRRPMGGKLPKGEVLTPTFCPFCGKKYRLGGFKKARGTALVRT